MKTSQNPETLQQKGISCPDLLESMSDGVGVYEAVDNGQDFVFCEHNPAAEKITGIPREMVIGRRVTEVFPGVEDLGLLDLLRRVFVSGKPEKQPIRKYQDRRITLWVENSVFQLPNSKIVAVYRNITEQQNKQRQIDHLSLLHKTGLAVHRHLATITDQQELLQAICDVFVNEKGYSSAWVATFDKKQPCKLAAHTGLLKDFSLLSRDMHEGILPPCMVQAMTEQKFLWQSSQEDFCVTCPLLNGYPDAGIMTTLLKCDQKVYAVMTVSLPSEMVTNSNERESFEEIGKDIGLALFNREQKKKRAEHEQELAIRDEISRTFIIHQDNNLYGGVLEIVLSALESTLGVFGYLDGPDMLICPSMTNEVWDQCQMSDKSICFPQEQWACIWKEALTNGATQYSNTPFTVPKGHLPINNSMAAAIIYDNQVIGLLQVANKKQNYNEKDKRLLESMAATIAPILQARLEQQHAETKLQDALEEYADLYNNAPDMFLSMEADTAKILNCNQTLLDTLGYDREEIIGQPVFKFYHPDCVDKCREESFPTFCKTGIISNLELKLQRKDGSTLPVTLDVSAVRDADNNIIHSRSVYHDISARKKLEEQMLISEKMTTIAGLAAGVAHEINTPLSGILQAIQIIELGLDPDNKQNRTPASTCGIDLAKVQKYLQERELAFFLDGIRNSATTAAKIIADLLQFSRPQESIPIQANLNELIDRSIELAKTDYKLKKEFNILHVTFVRQYSPAPLQVNCLAMEIEQVLINLIKNACQAMAETNDPASSQIILRTERREDIAVIEVEDNGPGMKEEIRNQIFDPFFTTKDIGQGTGLGLSVSYSIIKDKHGGTIRAESTPGKGTRIIIELPFNNGDNV